MSKTYLLEVLVTVDDDEAGPTKEKEIRSVIENLDPAIGIFEVNSCEVT